MTGGRPDLAELMWKLFESIAIVILTVFIVPFKVWLWLRESKWYRRDIDERWQRIHERLFVVLQLFWLILLFVTFINLVERI